MISHEPVEIQPDLLYMEQPVAILDQNVQHLWNKSIASVKVLWRNFSREEATWELEDAMKKQYPPLFE